MISQTFRVFDSEYKLIGAYDREPSPVDGRHLVVDWADDAGKLFRRQSFASTGLAWIDEAEMLHWIPMPPNPLLASGGGDHE